MFFIVLNKQTHNNGLFLNYISFVTFQQYIYIYIYIHTHTQSIKDEKRVH